MNLPFSHDQFLDVFGAYNEAFWPAVILLWMVTAASVVAFLRKGAAFSRAIALLLVLHWGWSGIAYHLLYFRAINPAAALFGTAFVVEAGLLAWLGVWSQHLTFAPSTSFWSRTGIGLVLVALIYPAAGVMLGLSWPRIPLFAVPCPTTLLTAGLLMNASRRAARTVAVIPLLWSAVGSSAAIVLGIRADLALMVAGITLLAYIALPTRHAPATAA